MILAALSGFWPFTTSFKGCEKLFHATCFSQHHGKLEKVSNPFHFSLEINKNRIIPYCSDDEDGALNVVDKFCCRPFSVTFRCLYESLKRKKSDTSHKSEADIEKIRKM